MNEMFTRRLGFPGLSGIARAMAILGLWLIAGITVAHAEVADQQVTTPLTVSVENATIREVFTDIERQSTYVFIYSDEVGRMLSGRVSVKAEKEPVEKILDRVLAGSGLVYKVHERQIMISKQPAAPAKENRKPTSVTLAGNIISSSSNNSLAGVSVFIEGTSVGTISGANGEYSITVPANTKEVTFSLLGYDTRKLQLENPVLFKLVTMYEAVQEIDDVVVVGFGTQKKESLVGAVQAVKPSELKVTSSNLTTAFAGKIAGVVSVQSSGEPGADGASFWIRGISTFGANRTPLIILDGVEIVQEMLNNIAPESIESFSVLKDATATALYGSRGANGVMIVTTKSGRDSEKMAVNVRVEAGMSMPTKVQKVADGVTYMEAYNEAQHSRYNPSGGVFVPFYSDGKIANTRANRDPYIYPNNDWYDMLFKDVAFNQNINLNLRGGSKKIDYFLNAAFHNEEGMMKNTGLTKFDNNISMQKYLFQSNISAAVTRTTRVSMKTNAQMFFRTYPVESASNLFYYTMRANPVDAPPTFPAEWGDGETDLIFGRNANSWNGGSINPYALMSRGYNKINTNYLTTTFDVNQDLKFITPGLTARAMVSFYMKAYSRTERSFEPFYYQLSDYIYNPGTDSYEYDIERVGTSGTTYLGASKYHSGELQVTVQGALEYTRTFNKKHDVNALLVYQQYENRPIAMNNSGSVNEYTILSSRQQGLAGRFTYGFDSRYLFEFNFGYNGSENFMKGKRFGFFPSVAAGWVISNEPFFKPLSGVVSLLKVRASYGLSGNDYYSSSDRFAYITNINMNKALYVWFGDNFVRQTGVEIARLGNEDATWETSRKLNIGIELGLFNDLTVQVDLFNEKRSDILLARKTLPSSMGLSNATPYANIGKMENKGIDLSVEYNKAVNKDFIVSFRGTFTYAHNEVVFNDEAKQPYDYMSKVGKPYNSYYGLVSAGLFTSQEEIDAWPYQTYNGAATYMPGDIKYVDLNGDGVIDDNDQTVIGNPSVPEITYGFGPSIKYKNWDFSLFFQGTGRVSLRMYNMHPFRDASINGFNIMQYIVDDHWSLGNQNPDAKYPRLSVDYNLNNEGRASTYWLRDASYLRLKNAEVGYTYKGLRVYLSGSNLVTFSKFKLWDPELGGGSGLSYPQQRTVRLGVQYNF